MYDIEPIINKYDVICIDEIQFYKDAHIFCDKWANLGKIIEACGLNGTFDRKPFEEISKLIPFCEDITYQTAICKKNGNNAPYSKRLTPDNSEVLIGNMYDAVDRSTYYTENSSDELYKIHEISKFKEFIGIYLKRMNIEHNSVVANKMIENYVPNVNFAELLQNKSI